MPPFRATLPKSSGLWEKCARHTSASTARTLSMICLLVVAVSAMAGRVMSDHEALQGKWRVIDARARLDSEPATVATEGLRAGTIIFALNRMTMRDISGNGDFAFSLDTSTSPRRIDLLGEGSSSGMTWSGIYRVTSDTLRLSLPIEHWTDRHDYPKTFGGPNALTLLLARVK
jgi:uncharacterized protein (TIGR03067 family)